MESRREKQNVCHLFRSTGRCRYGNKCKYSHDAPESSTTTSKSSSTSQGKSQGSSNPGRRKIKSQDLKIWNKILHQSKFGTPHPKALAMASTLDESQSLALLNSLRRCIGLTEGPPGTGKSYVGGALIRTLLSSKAEAKLGPIICVTYTNHALDQVLEHLHEAGVKKIVRMGTRSKSEVLKNVTLKVISKDEPKTREERAKLWQSHTDIDEMKADADGAIGSLSRADEVRTMKAYLETNHPKQHDQIFRKVDEEGFQEGRKSNPSKQLWRWLNGGSQRLSGGGQPHSRLERDIAKQDIDNLDLKRLGKEDRARLRDYWVNYLYRTQMMKVEFAENKWKTAKNVQKQVYHEVDARCLRQADIVGVTTSGLARNVRLLRQIKPKVLICEEAGEVLEAHLLTALLPTIEHAILIGDHLQLRPHISNYDLQGTHERGKRFSLDVSLFERLVTPFQPDEGPLPYSTLWTQRRMDPSISALIRPRLYPKLQDAEIVKNYPGICGMRRRLFWLNHQEPETRRDPQSGIETSYSNQFELNMTVALVAHLVRQGKYKAGEIAVLTPYMAQFHQLRQRLGNMFAVTMNERDQKDLEAEEMDMMDMGGEVANSPMIASKSKLLETVRIATIDNFQGEEATVVVISLVRSNNDGKVGFLKTSNRINVLLSRAKHGMFIIGDEGNAASVPMWAEVIDVLKKGGNLGERLPLKCPRHPNTEMVVSQPDHFLQFAPDGGCNLRCEKRLDCGHGCTGRCHSDVMHSVVKCQEPCPRGKSGCEHDCPLPCGEACEKQCNVMLDGLNLTLSCGHVVNRAVCWQAQDPSKIICHIQMKKTVPRCGHNVEVMCFQDVSHKSWTCKASCGADLLCGHACKRQCCDCRETTDGRITKEEHGACIQTCGRNFTNCRHSCQQACHDGKACPPCGVQCENRCSHSQCNKRCYEPCTPCAKASCSSMCVHGACTMPCAAPCDWIPCSRRCELLLGCGHRCPSFCGEVCPSAKFCQKCASPSVASEVVDMIMMQTYQDINLDESPCIFLDCGHFFTGETLDGQMEMGLYYNSSENGVIESLRTSSTPFSEGKIKVCPNCRGSLRNIARYGRLIRRGILDEATKKFIIWSMQEYAKLGEELLLAQDKSSDSKAKIEEKLESSELQITGTREEQVKVLGQCPLGVYLKPLLEMRSRIKKHLNLVVAKEQPFLKVANLVRYARKHHQAQGGYEFDDSVIQTKGHIQTLSLLVRCEIMILAKFIELSSSSVEGRCKVSQVDLSTNREDTLALRDMSEDAQHPYEQTESYIYTAQLCAVERSILLKNTSASDQVSTLSTDLREKGINYLSKAKALLRQCPPTASLETEIDATTVMLGNGTFYTAVSKKEKVAVYRAMQKEFSGTGHWYTCVNGHPFTIGECGGAMQERTCPECGATIGGQNHRTAEGVRPAFDMESLVRAL